jgi:hypothetical protein
VWPGQMAVPERVPLITAGNSADDFALLNMAAEAGVGDGVSLFIDSRAIPVDTAALVRDAESRGWAVHTPRSAKLRAHRAHGHKDGGPPAGLC